MGDYGVKLVDAAVKEIRKLPRTAQKRVITCLENLSKDPRPSGVEKLSENPRFWRVRSGDYRIIFYIDDAERLVVALVVRHRKDAYRNLDQLDARLMAATFAPLLIGASVHS